MTARDCEGLLHTSGAGTQKKIREFPLIPATDTSRTLSFFQADSKGALLRRGVGCLRGSWQQCAVPCDGCVCVSCSPLPQRGFTGGDGVHTQGGDALRPVSDAHEQRESRVQRSWVAWVGARPAPWLLQGGWGLP